MRQPDEAISLSEIAEEAGLSRSDVALIADLDESTISRLWSNPKWLDRVKGISLQHIMASVPGAAEYVTTYSLASRLSGLVSQLSESGLEVDTEAIRSYTAEGNPAPYVANALQGALYTMRGDTQKAASYLARFWAKDQDQALGRLFSAGPNRLLTDPDQLIQASVELAPLLRQPGYSFHAILAEAAIVHHVRAEPRVSDPARIGDRQEAMSLRSSVMGKLIDTNDLDLADKYRKMASKSPIITGIEEWSFPTYTRDIRPDSAFSLPRSLLLRNTAEEVIREIDCYSDAYVYYLLSVYIPLAISRDRTFGLALPRLSAAIKSRLSRDGDPRLRTLCESTLRNLEGVSGA